jgi:pyrroloquinoline quinone (PQQ) biosynthesis protein C
VPELNSAAAFEGNPLQPREIIVKKDDDPTGRKSGHSEPILSAIENLPNALAVIFEEHRPSRMPFFHRLAASPRAVARDPALLGQIHLIYQSAMHATRAAVYYLPHLDSPALRKRKLRIFIDDDGLADGDTHHYQLTRAFRSIGAACLLDDEEFGELGELCHYLEGETADFVRLAPKLYVRSLGAWCAVEMLSADWMRALADALSVHFPHFRHEPYFEECFSQQVEERHAAEALEVTQIVLRARPELLDETLRDARIMAEALDGVWAHLDRIVRHAQATIMPDRRIRIRRQPGTRHPALAPAHDDALLPAIATQENEIC